MELCGIVILFFLVHFPSQNNLITMAVIIVLIIEVMMMVDNIVPEIIP